MTTVKQILEWPLDYRSGGFDLTIKTAKKCTQVGETWYQDVMFTDGKDEIYGKLKLVGKKTLTRNMPIRIITCKRTEYGVNNKPTPALYCEQWDIPKMTADEWENEQSDLKKAWDKDQDKRIRGMCRHGIACAMIQHNGRQGLADAADEDIETAINLVVDYIMTGK